MKTRKRETWGTRDQVLSYRDELATEARELLALAEKESRALSPEEELAHDEVLTEIRRASAKLAEMDRDREGLEGMLRDLGRRADAGGTRGGWTAPARPSLGGQLVEHRGFQEYRQSLGSGFRVQMPGIELRAGELVAPPGGWAEGTLAPGPQETGLPPWGRLRVAWLPTVLPAAAGAVTVIVDQQADTAAAVVPEGTRKPFTALATAVREDSLKTIAHLASVSNVTLEDVPAIRTWVDSILVGGLLDVQDDQLVNGTGTGGQMLGYLHTPGLTAPHAKGAAETVADAVLAQVLAVQTAGRLPVDAVVFAPDAFVMLASTKATGSGVYLSGQPFAIPPALAVWGIRLAVSMSLPSGTALVGAFARGSTIHRRGMIRIDLSNSHEDYFALNLTAIRAEMRETLTVSRPSAFGLVTGLSAA